MVDDHGLVKVTRPTDAPIYASGDASRRHPQKVTVTFTIHAVTGTGRRDSSRRQVSDNCFYQTGECQKYISDTDLKLWKSAV
jgi:hypothetical protein